MFARTLAIVCTAAFLVTSTAAAESRGNLLLLYGRKALESSELQPVDRQEEFGVLLSLGRNDWPIFIAVDVLTANSEGEPNPELTGVAAIEGTYEVAFGVRGIWGSGATHPYLGAGVALLGAEVRRPPVQVDPDTDDRALGPWVGGGVFWRLGRRFNLGVDARWSAAEIVPQEFFGGSDEDQFKIGGFHAGITLGVAW